MDTELYWKERGRGYLSEFKRHNPMTRYRFWRQEQAIRNSLPDDIESVLEVGCGFGRITKILLENPDIERIVATDISPDQIDAAKEQIADDRAEFQAMSVLDLNCHKEFDLVIASEVLMHIPPHQIQDVMDRMERASKRYVMNVDWHAPSEPIEAGGYCWQHDYCSLYSNAELTKRLHRQGIFIGRVD